MNHPSQTPSEVKRSSGPIHSWALVGLLAANGVMAITSMVGDSITFDETNHLTGGMSYLLTGDFRLAPETPPLAQMWAALPLLFVDSEWPSATQPAWTVGNVWQIGREWLFERNDGESLVLIARFSTVLLLSLTCFFTYLLARSLFSPTVALLAAAMACMSPTLLAHGRLVTTDIAFTLGCLVVILAFARLVARISLPRVVVAAGSLAILTLVKFSWPIVLAPILAMFGFALFRERGIPCAASVARAGLDDPVRATGRVVTSRRQRALVLASTLLLAGMFSWAAIWTCFGWRYSPFRGEDSARAMMTAIGAPNRPHPATMDQAWDTVLVDWDGEPMTGPIAQSIKFARRHRLLPEAYLYGVAHTLKFLHGRPTYLMGEYSRTGWWTYFPTAFAIKTPIVTMLLILAGCAALLGERRLRVRDAPLLFGVLAFVLAYVASALTTKYNIGHRHLLPIYPMLFVLGGCSVRWLATRAGRWLVWAACAGLAVTSLAAFPNYLGFFNAFIGGPSRGHLYLADSNIDWGQDLKRLAEYVRPFPDETVKLAYFGSALPTKYGFRCEAMPSFFPFGPPAKLTPGIYVSSVTQLLGVFDERIRDSFWNGNTMAVYRSLHDEIGAKQSDLTTEQRDRRALAIEKYDMLRRVRLLNRLSHRAPDARIGTSLFVHVLTQAEIDDYTDPGGSESER